MWTNFWMVSGFHTVCKNQWSQNSFIFKTKAEILLIILVTGISFNFYYYLSIGERRISTKLCSCSCLELINMVPKKISNRHK